MNQFEKIILPRKLTLILAPVKDVETFTFIIASKTGSKYETLDNNGISHLLEHMVFKGTDKYKNQQELSFALENIGSSYNAFTDKEVTAYYVKGNVKYWQEAIEILASMYLKPRLPEEELEKEKAIIRQEIYMYHDNPERYVSDLFEYTMFDGSSLGFEIAGSEESLAKINWQTLKDYYQSNYIPSNTIIVAAGSIDKKKLLSAVDKLFVFNKDSHNKSANHHFRVSIDGKPELRIHYKETKEAHIKIGFPAYAFNDERRYALSILSGILGQGMGSWLFSCIREKLGLCYYIFSEPVAYKETGFLAIQAGLNNDKLRQGIIETFKILKKLRDSNVSLLELERAKNFLIGNFLLSLESNSQLANFYLMQEVADMPKILTPAEIVNKTSKITAQNIKTIARDIIKNRYLKVALIGQFEKEALEQTLKFDFE